MHTLLVLDPGHFHAALTLRVSHPRVADEVFVYAREGAELRDFLALLERFNTRPQEPTRWRPVVTTGGDPLGRLVQERRGDVVVVAGRNGGKARTLRRLHEAGLHVLADKPWLVDPEDLDDVRASLDGWPLVMEIMTGRHDVPARLWKKLVNTPEIFGSFREDAFALEVEGIHQLEKLVDGAPLRRPWWFFDVRAQGSGVVDIPTHVVDQAQGLLEDAGVTADPVLVSARLWPTRVPSAAFCRITGEAGFHPELRSAVEGGELAYLGNATLIYRIAHVTAQATTRWNLSTSGAESDAHRSVAHGTRADVRLEQAAHTGHRRRLFVEPRGLPDVVARALHDTVRALQAEFPGVAVERRVTDSYEVTVPPALDRGHESHFARVLDSVLTTIDEHRWPTQLARRTLAKYTLLAAAAETTRASATRASGKEQR